jgi:hypothetical protein
MIPGIYVVLPTEATETDGSFVVARKSLISFHPTETEAQVVNLFSALV